MIPCEDEKGVRYEVTLWREWRDVRRFEGHRQTAGVYFAAVEGPGAPRRLDILHAYDEFRFRDTGQVIRRISAHAGPHTKESG